MAKTPFKLRSGNNLGGRNGKGVNFKEMGSSPVEQSDIVESFKNFMTSKQTKEGGDIGDLKRRTRHSNIEVRTKAQAENRARLKKAKETKVKTVETVKTEEGKREDFKTHEFTRQIKPGHMDPYSYRTKEGGGYEFQSLEGKGGRTKGEWYTPTAGVSDIEKAYKKSLETE